MKQLIQNFKTGKLIVDQVPLPALSDGFVLVENKFSLISAGTEKSTVSVGQASLLGKAKKRPDLVKQVLENVQREGIKATYEKVRGKLDSLKALGYSTSGIVHASLDTNGNFQAGDRVACAGQDYASHAEMVSIPQNLMAKIPDNVSFEEASFTTLGAIAMQGVRQSSPELGEIVCVIGLGLLGQITCQLLKANGCQVFGIDVSDSAVNIARNTSKVAADTRSNPKLIDLLGEFTKGKNFDKVIITAAAPTTDPIDLASQIVRKKGSITLVGAVPMELKREPYFYKKEIEFKLSCSYGPGRYDVNYEEQGQDYPYAYVRWTEQRNMESFLQLISDAKMNIKELISHTFDLDSALEAYDIILGKKKEPFLGILLKYSDNTEKLSPKVRVTPNQDKSNSTNIAFIGAGSFAQSYLIPHASKMGTLSTVVTRNGFSGKGVATKFGFKDAATDRNIVWNDKETPTVFVATRHNSHAEIVTEALKNKKNVFVEKPLALNYEELIKVSEEYSKSGTQLMVGFNRRFSPLAQKIKQAIGDSNIPLIMNYRINAGRIPKDHWIQTSEGGGRIIGEICHFIDLFQYFSNSHPVSVYASCTGFSDQTKSNKDNIIITLKFKNGSIGVITYLSEGQKSIPKERVEVFAGDVSAILDDFKQAFIHRKGKVEKITAQGKGHKEEVRAFLESLKNDNTPPISFESIFYTTLTTFKIIDSLTTSKEQTITL